MKITEVNTTDGPIIQVETHREKLLRRKVEVKERKRKQFTSRTFTCLAGETVLHNGGLVYVAELLDEGNEPHVLRTPKGPLNKPGVKSFIKCNKIDIDGTILKRSNIYVGQDWKHVR